MLAGSAVVVAAVPADARASFLVGSGPVGPLAFCDRRVASFLVAGGAAVVAAVAVVEPCWDRSTECVDPPRFLF